MIINNSNNRDRWKLWEVMAIFMALMLTMVSQVHIYLKFIKLYTLNMYTFLYVNQISMKWFYKKEK